MIVNYRNYQLNCQFVGVKPDILDNSNHNQNVIVVTNTDTNKWLIFDYWGSRMYPEIENKEMAVEAFEEFLDNVAAGRMPFEEFCAVYGYNDDSRKVERFHRLCKKLAKRFDKINNAS